MLAHAFIKQVNSAAASSSSSRAQAASRSGGSGRAGLYASAQGPDVIWGQVTDTPLYITHPRPAPISPLNPP